MPGIRQRCAAPGQAARKAERRRLAPPLSMPVDTSFYGSCVETWTQAMSYCETALPLAGVFSVCPLPAYLVPAIPGVDSLNGAPSVDDDLPGVCSALALTVQLFPAVVPG